jgi:hypothetical protein
MNADKMFQELFAGIAFFGDNGNYTYFNKEYISLKEGQKVFKYREPLYINPYAPLIEIGIIKKIEIRRISDMPDHISSETGEPVQLNDYYLPIKSLTFR